MYQGGRPTRFASFLNRLTVILAGAGVPPKRQVVVEVRGRRTGRRLSFPLVVADYEGERYLVAMLGNDANWVKNARAAGWRVVLRHGRREAVRLEEVVPDERPPILKRYLELAPGARAHIPVDRRAPLTEFEPIAGDYPVFRIRS